MKIKELYEQFILDWSRDVRYGHAEPLTSRDLLMVEEFCQFVEKVQGNEK